jgi:hypothetical protein
MFNLFGDLQAPSRKYLAPTLSDGAVRPDKLTAVMGLKKRRSNTSELPLFECTVIDMGSLFNWAVSVLLRLGSNIDKGSLFNWTVSVLLRLGSNQTSN